ncbi:MAG: hypothetical protein IKN74_00215 [Clostridia bacterium]|nr:hypothetical protein [Clostridia bacterium]
MTLNDIEKINNLFIYMTLSDIPLFTRDNKVANEIIHEIRKKAGQEVGVDDLDSIKDKELLSAKEKEATPYFNKYFMHELMAHEEYIDVDKYLLVSAFRNAEVLQNIYLLKNGGGAFPDSLKGLLSLRKEYASSLLKLSALMEGRKIRVKYEAGIYDGVPQGYWNDYEQEFQSLDVTNQDIKTFTLTPAFKDAMGLPIKGPAKIDMSKFTGTQSLEDIVTQINQQAKQHATNAADIVRYALEHHGIQRVNGKIVAYSPYGQAELDNSTVRKIRGGYDKTVDDLFNLVNDHSDHVNHMDLIDSLIPSYEISFNEMLYSKSTSRKIDKTLRLFAELMRNNPELKKEVDIAMRDYVEDTPSRTTYEEASTVSKDINPDTVYKKLDEIKELRADIVMGLMNYGIIDYEIIRTTPEFIEMLSTEKVIDKYYRANGYLSKEQALEIAAGTVMSGRLETDAETLANKYHYNKVNQPEGGLRPQTLRTILELFPEEELRSLYLKGLLDQDDLYKRGIRAETILNQDDLSENMLIAIIAKLDEENGMFEITENALVNRYGINLSRIGIMKYAIENRISSSILLELYLREDVKLKEGFEYITEDDMTSYFNFERLNGLDGKVFNKKFKDNFKIMISNMPKEKQEEYFNSLVNEIEKQEGKEELYFKFYKNGIIDAQYLKGKLSKDYVEEVYTLEELSTDEIYSLYQDGILSINEIKDIFTSDDIFDAVLDGKMDYRGLRDLESDFIELALEEEAIGINELMILYKDSLDYDRLKAVLDTVDLSNIELGKYIPDGTDKAKVEELIKGEYLSHDEISDLVARGLVDKDKADKYVEMLSSLEEFKKLFDTEDRRATLVRDTEKGESREKTDPIGPVDPVRTRQKIDPDLQEKFIKALGAYPNVIYLTGMDNTLNGYSIYGFKDERIMVFLNLEKKSQATYVMSFLQGKYYLNKIQRAQRQGKQIEIKEGLESTATKGEIRSDTEHVKIKNASRGWGKNIVKAMKQVSSVFSEKYKNNKTYREKIEKLSEEIGMDYDKRLEEASL